MTTYEAMRQKRAEIDEIARRHGVLKVRVFGSVARGEETPESDVDLLVVTGTKVSSWFPVGLMLDLEKLLGRRIDVVTEKGLDPLIKERILAEAVLL